MTERVITYVFGFAITNALALAVLFVIKFVMLVTGTW